MLPVAVLPRVLTGCLSHTHSQMLRAAAMGTPWVAAVAAGWVVVACRAPLTTR